MNISALNEFYKTGCPNAFGSFANSSKDWVETRICNSPRNYKGELRFWAEDLTQEVYLKLLNCYGKETAANSDKGVVEAWLATIVANVCIDFLRKKSTKTALKSRPLGLDSAEGDDSPADTLPDTVAMEAKAELAAAEEARAKLESLLSAAPELTRRVVVMSRLEGMTYAMIESKTGLSKPTISRIVTRFIDGAVSGA
jgi:RNA polymerase sigma factor (sigma-70 family)